MTVPRLLIAGLPAALLLAACSTGAAGGGPSPYAKVSGAADGAVADVATLSAPGLVKASELGPGWSGPEPVDGADVLAAGNCGVAPVDGSKPAGGVYTGPGGVTVRLYVAHAAPASVSNWMSGLKTVLPNCLGTSTQPAQPLPSLDGHPDTAGMRLGADTTWWGVGDVGGGYAAAAVVTVPPGSSGSNTDVWAAAAALSGLRAAAGSAPAPIGTPPPGGGDIAAPPAPDGGDPNGLPAGIPTVTGGGKVTLSDGTSLTMPPVVTPTPTPAPSGSAAGGTDAGNVTGAGPGVATTLPSPATIPPSLRSAP